MSDKIDELALPSAVIARILKDAVPDGINISKEAKATVARAASIFVLYATACASQVQAISQRKTLTVNDVYSALEDMMLEDMIEIVKESVEALHSDKAKKDSSASSPTKASSTPKAKRKRSSESTITRETDMVPVDSGNIIEKPVDNENEGPVVAENVIETSVDDENVIEMPVDDENVIELAVDDEMPELEFTGAEEEVS